MKCWISNGIKGGQRPQLIFTVPLTLQKSLIDSLFLFINVNNPFLSYIQCKSIKTPTRNYTIPNRQTGC